MECFKVYANQIEGRIDSNFYQPKFVKLENEIFNGNVEYKEFNKLIKKIINGYDYREFTEEGTNYLRVSNIKPFELNLEEVKKINVSINDIGKDIELKKGNILLTRKGTYGVAHYLKEDYDYIISSEIFKIELLKDSDISPDFLVIVLNSKICQLQFYRHSIGAIMGSLSQEAIKKIKIPIPPLEIQNKIVQIMDRAYNTKKQKEEEAQKLIDSIDEYILSELDIAVPKIQTKMCFKLTANEITGTLSPLHYISETSKPQGYLLLKDLANINPSRESKVTQLEDIVPYVGLPETEVPRIKEVLLRPYREVKGRKIIRKGDILFARIEPSVFNKKYIFVDNLFSHDYAFTSTEFIIIEPKQKINSLYLYYILFSDIVYNQVIGKTTGSTGRRRLDIKVLRNLLLPYPLIGIQNKIANEVKSRMNKADQLSNEARIILDEAREKVEKIILS